MSNNSNGPDTQGVPNTGQPFLPYQYQYAPFPYGQVYMAPYGIPPNGIPPQIPPYGYPPQFPGFVYPPVIPGYGYPPPPFGFPPNNGLQSYLNNGPNVPQYQILNNQPLGTGPQQAAKPLPLREVSASEINQQKNTVKPITGKRLLELTDTPHQDLNG